MVGISIIVIERLYCNYLLLLLGPAQLWQEIISVGPIIASALAPARQGAASVAETFLLYLG